MTANAEYSWCLLRDQLIVLRSLIAYYSHHMAQYGDRLLEEDVIIFLVLVLSLHIYYRAKQHSVSALVRRFFCALL